MRNVIKSIGKVVAVLALFATAVAAGEYVIGSCTARDFARCVQGCNATRKACADQCRDDCLELYLTNVRLREKCNVACKNICVEESQDCKNHCQEVKDPSTRECP